MLDKTKPVLVFGATGLTGIQVVKSLLSKGFKVRAVVRDPQKGLAELGAGVDILALDLNDTAALGKILTGIPVIISALGSQNTKDPDEKEQVEHIFVVNLAAAAQEAGTEHIVMCSSIGTDKPEKFPFIEAVLRFKAKGEAALQNSGLTYTIVRPGGLNNNPGGQGVLLKDSLEVGGMISRVDVAEVMVQAILQPAAHNRVVEIINQPDAPTANRPDLF